MIGLQRPTPCYDGPKAPMGGYLDSLLPDLYNGLKRSNPYGPMFPGGGGPP